MLILDSVKFSQVVQKCEMEEHRHNNNHYDLKNMPLSFFRAEVDYDVNSLIVVI
jgi:hypothetical protein